MYCPAGHLSQGMHVTSCRVLFPEHGLKKYVSRWHTLVQDAQSGSFFPLRTSHMLVTYCPDAQVLTHVSHWGTEPWSCPVQLPVRIPPDSHALHSTHWPISVPTTATSEKSFPEHKVSLTYVPSGQLELQLTHVCVSNLVYPGHMLCMTCMSPQSLQRTQVTSEVPVPSHESGWMWYRWEQLLQDLHDSSTDTKGSLRCPPSHSLSRYIPRGHVWQGAHCLSFHRSACFTT